MTLVQAACAGFEWLLAHQICWNVKSVASSIGQTLVDVGLQFVVAGFIAVYQTIQADDVRPASARLEGFTNVQVHKPLS